MSEPSPPTVTRLHAQHQLATGSIVAGRFRIEAVLGVGGMGVVYRATDVTLEVPVALKLLRPELAARGDAFERFRQELLTARQVSSPRVVRIHDIAGHEGQWLISMDLIDGESLDRRLDRDGAMAPEVAARIARQLAEGLSAAHARGVVHRDLKPANVLIDRAGEAYITDFGIARTLAGAGLTQSGVVIGTPDYLSPEQARGEAVDARSDLYALGLILYEMLTGTLPFAGGTVSEALARRMLRTPPPVSKLCPQTPAWMVRLVDRLLRPQPAHRLQSADAIVRAIDRREVPRDFRIGRRLGLGVAATMLALAGGFGLLHLLYDAAPEDAAAQPPLRRLLVLPIEAPDGQVPAARRAALGAQLRIALGAVPGFAVVDEDRTQQALRQLDPAGVTAPDPTALRRVVGADRILGVRLQQLDDRWQASADLQGGDRLRIAGQGSDPLAAFADLLAQPALARLAGTPAPLSPAPLPVGALDDYGAGLLARQRDRPAEALPPLRAAVAAAPEFAAAWLALSDAAQAIGEQELAYEALERGQRAAAAAMPEALLRRFRAERALLEGDPSAAAAEWRALLEATPDDTFADLNLARALGAGGDFAAATARLRDLAARDADDPRAWFELGKFSILQGEAQRAVDEYLVRALVLYKRSGNRYGEAETVNALGIGYLRLGQRGHAEEQYRKAVELRRAVGNRRGLATSLRNLGNTLSLSGKFDGAAAHFGQARELYAALRDHGGLAAVEREIGLLAEERGDYPKALAAFRRALKGWQQLGDTSGIAQALDDIGFAQYQLGAYDDAQAYLVQSGNAYAELGDDTGRIRTQQNLGLLAIARGRWAEAREQLDASLAAAEALQMVEEAAVSRRNLAELEFWQGHLAAAVAQTDKAEALFRQGDDRRGIADAGLLRVQVLSAAHADAAAAEALAALAGPIAQASVEQRGIAALLRAELARRRDDHDGEAQARAEARRHARASGVRLLQLQQALADARDPTEPALAQAIADLGHAGLRLQWTEAAMRRALAAQDAAAAARLYRDAQPLLRRGDYVHGFRLHHLGAQALAGQGDAAAAADAADSARAGVRALRAAIPASLHDDFDAAPQVAAVASPP